jgi:hypothetical protein
LSATNFFAATKISNFSRRETNEVFRGDKKQRLSGSEIPRFLVHRRPIFCGGKKIRKPNTQRLRGLAAKRIPELLSAPADGSVLEKFLGLAVGKFLDEFLARSLRRRAGQAGVPWPLSEATPALFLQEPGHIVQAKFFSISDSLIFLLQRQ